jgi:D-glycero-alpha-D-manno-heptose 1-phosphate guanylyltransferase
MSAADVIVLAGGFGTRLRSVVPDLPKPLAPVAGRPFLAYVLDRYAAAGMRRAILATGFRSEAIEQAIGSNWKGMEILISREQSPLGTGGAIRQAGRLVGGDGAHVANGDTFLRFDAGALEAATRSAGTPMGVALVAVDDVRRHGTAKVSGGRVVGFTEKGGSGPGLINAGSYFLTADGFAQLPAEESFSFEEKVLTPWAAAGKVTAYEGVESFIDIGVPQDYARAQHLLAAE